MNERILIVDDENEYVESFAEILQQEKYLVENTATYSQTMEKIMTFEPDLITLDLNLQDGCGDTGSKILSEIRSRKSKEELPVLVISGTGDVDKFSKIMQLGANEYIAKPIDFKILLEKIKNLLNRDAAAPARLFRPWQDRLIGSSPRMINLAKEIYELAKAGGQVLMLGETGTGKSLLARTYYQYSSRHDRMFYTIDCPAIPNTLFEAEIFGSVPGAFDGAKRLRKGKLEEADGGIVFFDEVADLSPEVQAKLLNVLATKTFTRLGSNEVITIDVLVLAATNQDLYAMTEKGKFRKDLYYRLGKNIIVLPPLREHRQDIPQLVEHFIAKSNQDHHKQVAGTTEEVLDLLAHMPWEGNVQQLMDCIAAGVRNCQSRLITRQDLESYLSTIRLETDREARGFDFEVSYKDFKAGCLKKLTREYLLHHLRKKHWNISETAESIGLTSRQQLNQMIKVLGINREIPPRDAAG